MKKLTTWVIPIVVLVGAAAIVLLIFILNYSFWQKIDYKYGIISRSGQFIVQPKYDFLEDYDKSNKTLGYIFNPASEDSFAVYVYVIDKNGNIKKQRSVYKDIRPKVPDPSVDKYGSIYIGEKLENENKEMSPTPLGKHYGYQNQKRQWVIKPSTWSYATNFENGVAFVSIGEGKNTKWGLINKQGEYVLKPICIEIWPFKEDLARCKVKLINGKF